MRIFPSLTLVISLLFLNFNVMGQQKIEEELPPRELRYGIDKTYEPYEFLNKEKEAVGFNVDIVKAIGKELNWDVKVYGDDWKIVREKLEKSNEIDAVAYFKSSSRNDSILFSRPISLVYYSIFTRADTDYIDDLIGLAGKKVAIQEASIVEEYFDQLGFLNLDELQTYPSEAAAIEAVSNGDADCAITSFMTTNYKMKAENITNILSSSDPVFIAEYCFAVKSENAALLDSVNWGLKLIRASGKYDNIYQKWLTPKKSWWDENLQLLLFAVSIFLLLSSVIGIYIFSLRKSVKKKSVDIKKEMENRSRTEVELLESENIRKKMEIFTSVMLVEVNLDNKIISAPKLFYSVLGYDNEELLEVNIHEILRKESVKKDKEIKGVLMNQEFAYLDTEYEFKSKLNTSVWMDCSISVSQNANHKINGFSMFLRDVTPLKIANISLRDLNAELSNFMYKTSHDVRGPIANVLGLVNLGHMKAQDEEVLYYFDLIKKSTEKLELIFNNFKEMSFILHGDLNFTTFDVKDLINEVIQAVFLKRNKKVAKGKIEIFLNTKSNFITSDRPLLKRLFYQIIENVFEHNDYYNTRLKITFEQFNFESYRILFEDDGIGIAHELQEKVFEVFFKGKRSDINVGMGLYMAKKVVSRLEGEMQLESEPEHGTRIQLLLPTRQMLETISHN